MQHIKNTLPDIKVMFPSSLSSLSLESVLLLCSFFLPVLPFRSFVLLLPSLLPPFRFPSLIGFRRQSRLSVQIGETEDELVSYGQALSETQHSLVAFLYCCFPYVLNLTETLCLCSGPPLVCNFLFQHGPLLLQLLSRFCAHYCDALVECGLALKLL